MLNTSKPDEINSPLTWYADHGCSPLSRYTAWPSSSVPSIRLTATASRAALRAVARGDFAAHGPAAAHQDPGPAKKTLEAQTL
jgi:hypothetical protein